MSSVRKFDKAMKLKEWISKLEMRDVVSVCKFILAFLPSLVLRCRRKNIWICCERIDYADDNAWMLFNWVRKEFPNRNIYFIVSRNSNVYDKKNNHIIAWGSMRHYVYYLCTTTHIMATFQIPSPNGRITGYLNKFFNRKINKIYLSHGISKDGMAKHTYAEHHFRLYACGAKPMYDAMIENSDYPADHLKYTGLARFDDLISRKRDDRFILLIPTWRRYIGYDPNLTSAENDKAFKESEYYKRYLSLLNNKRLHSFLEKENYTLKFCLHAMYKKYESLFNTDNPRVEIVDENISIHELLLSCSLLITDYSSVFFDVAYVHKPIIFYHFDYEEFREKHLDEGYFSYVKHGMGPVVTSEGELLDEISSCYKKDRFLMSESYIKRAEVFFPYHDANNCRRILQAIDDCVN